MDQNTRRSFLALTCAVPAAAFTAEDESMVSGPWPVGKLAEQLVPRAQWNPFPRIGNRAAWSGLPGAVRETVLKSAAGYAGKPWAALPATLFLEFRRNGNRSHYEDVSFARRNQLSSLVLGECMEDKGRFLDDIATGIWAICEESFWGVPAHNGGEGLPDVARPIIDLFAAETSALLAWTDYLLGEKLDTVSPVIRRRIAIEASRRILEPGLERDDFGWMGLRTKAPVNNWNPWICSNWLSTALLLEKDEKKRVAAVHKNMRCLDRFMAGYAPDGGCDEGPGYWGRAGASLFDALLWLSMASNGRVDYFKMPLVAEIGRYIYRAHIAGEWYVNFADAPARMTPSADLVYRYGRAIGDRPMMEFGAWLRPAEFPVGDSMGRLLPALFNRAEFSAAKGAAPLLRDAWFAGIQVMTARLREGDPKSLYVAAQGGHNAESHNHNDVGNFIVYAGGEPAIIDVGVERYTAKTFSSKRYEIWTMQSAYHNCPTVNGVMQSAGRRFEASEVRYRNTDDFAELSLNLAKAYPPEAGIRSWKRDIRLERGAGRLRIVDEYSLNGQPSAITLTLMTPVRPRVGPGGIELPGRVNVSFDAGRLTPVVEEIPVTDARLLRSWPKVIYRILLKADKPGSDGRFEVGITPVSRPV